MKVLLLDNEKIISLVLPLETKGNYWVVDSRGNKLVSIEGQNGSWKLLGNSETKIINAEQSSNLKLYTFYEIVNSIENLRYYIYTCEYYDKSFIQLLIKQGIKKIVIGNESKNIKRGDNPVESIDISYNNPIIEANQVQLVFENNYWRVSNLHKSIILYVNNIATTDRYLFNGDIVFIGGLIFSLVGDILLINNPSGLVQCNQRNFTTRSLPVMDFNIERKEQDYFLKMYKSEDYFFRPPRFKNSIEKVIIEIDDIPPKDTTEETPLIYVLGPMLAMGITSLTTGLFALLRVINGETTMINVAPTLIMAFAMMTGTLIFPALSKQYMKRKKLAKEEKRVKKYTEYIKNKSNEITAEIQKQKSILEENMPSLEECANIILKRKRNLWERKIEHEDFLQLRIGHGTSEPEIEIKSPKPRFEVEEDELKDVLQNVINQSTIMNDVPISLSLTENNISAIIGLYNITKTFLDGLILQMLTYHSYDDLKIIVFTNSFHKNKYDDIKHCPHCWNNEKTTRFFGTNINEINQISNYLDEEFQNRKEKTNKEKDKCNYTAFAPYYVLIIDDFEFVRNIGIIDNILNCDINIGYSLVILTEELNVLPNECQSFLTLDQTTATLFNSKHIMKNITVITPQYPSFLLTPCYTAIANIPIDISNSNFTLPQSYSFLEMYDVGNVQQLNSLNRWKESNPTSTLGAPVGVGENGELLRLDLHEKSHGPHGLIAGMTGSGKSEFIITYILSMAVNYSPHEINFVLIDYKGGGLAGAFENKEMGYKLPHLVGTITNLDTVELNRSLVSIESELKRRQAVFNKVRDQLQEATIDIYKYQRFYREKKVEEPLPHLFIICDEFAELKVQQPEFMDQLVSTARIGRSLGVHLILATQKPSGVVSDQIWSNSRFKVCLKVQEKADSTDMIKRPDAAMLNTVGRFYLQVGYNEYFALGQSAWCGANYYETDKRKKKMDTNLTFVDNIGNIIKSEDIKDTSDISRSKGEELPNILSYIIDISNQGNYNVKQLWLTRIPNIIFVNNLIKKYNYNKENFNISPVIGEYDAPKEQKQGLLTLPLTTNGNTIIYGLVGSGKENLLTTIIYSLITTYVTEEINIYIVDFGAEQLTMFKNAPQVGDVITVNDTEKVTNLFKLIENLTKERKKLFQDYNGDWSLYCKNSGTTTPATIIIINNIEVFNEIYESYIDLLIILTRDCSRYGIIFIITATAVSSIRIKLNQNFPQILPLQLKDKYEYSNILGKTDNLVPSQVQGRGLVKLAAVYEFQSAYPCQVENMSDTIKNVCHQLQETLTTKAKPIAILPEVVNVSYVQDKLKGLTQVPVGIEKENLEITSFNFNNCGTIISATDINDCTNFVQSLAFEFTLLSNATVFILDAEKLILNPYPNYNYSFNDFDNVINILDDYITKMEDVKQESSSIETLNQYPNVICLIIGIEKFKTVITTETLTKFEQLTSRIKLIDKINFVFVDDNANIKKISYDNWYKNIINNISGIWIGPNVSDQTAIKINNVYKLNNNIDKKYGYLVSNGQTKLIKLIASYKEGNNE